MEPFFEELKLVKAGNTLYEHWLEYALSLTKDDIRDIVENGMTYQADALRSMVREIIAGQPIPETLQKKLDLILVISRRTANSLR
jgi:hypothetical protein